MAKINPVKLREKEKARELQEQQREALELIKVFHSSNGSPLTFSAKNKVSEFEKTLSEMTKKVSNLMVCSLDFSSGQIDSSLINLDVNFIKFE